MLKIKILEPCFVRSIPRELDIGILYISMEYATAVHSCCCGCREQVVTPFSPTDWKMIYDGETISLTPSIGNWHSACRSHYIIKQNNIIEAGNWSNNQILAERERDKAAKAHFYQSAIKSVSEIQQNNKPLENTLRRSSENKGFINSVRKWWYNFIKIFDI